MCSDQATGLGLQAISEGWAEVGLLSGITPDAADNGLRLIYGDSWDEMEKSSRLDFEELMKWPAYEDSMLPEPSMAELQCDFGTEKDLSFYDLYHWLVEQE